MKNNRQKGELGCIGSIGMCVGIFLLIAACYIGGLPIVFVIIDSIVLLVLLALVLHKS